MTITIDGPAAAGKSTLAKALADEFGFVYLNSGSIYRALAYHMANNPDEDDNPEIEFADNGHILINGIDRESEIRTPEISMSASRISKMPEVRESVDDTIHRMAIESQKGCVAEGRDMGTTVFPDAEIKIYLDAAPETRARRRFTEEGGESLAKVYEDVVFRDNQDMSREISPLRRADDAVLLCNDEMSVDDEIKWFEKTFGEFINK